jgi:hypothetical protein
LSRERDVVSPEKETSKMYNPDPINEEMGRRRLSNAAVAEMAGVNKKVVSAARNGKESVMLPSLKKVAEALNLNLELVVKLEKKAA